MSIARDLTSIHQGTGLNIQEATLSWQPAALLNIIADRRQQGEQEEWHVHKNKCLG